MLVRVRRGLTFSNAGWLVAVVFALGAGGYAVGAIPAENGKITTCYDKRTGELRVVDAERKKKCRKRERRLAFNPRGPTGPAGEQGRDGPAGTFADTLPAGRTLRGSWVIFDEAAASGEHLEEGVSFPVPLAAAPTAHFVASGGPASADCPGSAAVPAANPGHLCVFQSSVDIAATEENVFDPSTDTAAGAGKAGRLGFSVRVTAGASVVRTSGTWAVTAP